MLHRAHLLSHPWSVGALVVAGWLVLPGCAAIEDLAPPVSAATLRLAASRGVAPESPVRGRELYITSCARCHRPEPVARYGIEQWRQILPRMLAESKLGEEEAEAVEAYVILTVEVGSRQP